MQLKRSGLTRRRTPLRINRLTRSRGNDRRTDHPRHPGGGGSRGLALAASRWRKRRDPVLRAIRDLRAKELPQGVIEPLRSRRHG